MRFKDFLGFQKRAGFFTLSKFCPGNKKVISALSFSPSGTTVTLYYDPAYGGPEVTFPTGIQARLVDAYWVPARQEWWYWIGVNGFNGWTNDAFISRSAPQTTAEGPPVWIDAYDNLEMGRQSSLYARPEQGSDTVTELQAGAAVQARNLAWESETETWWYYVESLDGAGWVTADTLSR